jgi:hypothetical protein
MLQTIKKVRRFCIHLKRLIFTRQVTSIAEIDSDLFDAIVHRNGSFYFYRCGSGGWFGRPKFYAEFNVIHSALTVVDQVVYYKSKPSLATAKPIPDQLIIIGERGCNLYNYLHS